MKELSISTVRHILALREVLDLSYGNIAIKIGDGITQEQIGAVIVEYGGIKNVLSWPTTEPTDIDYPTFY